jgi:mono/diheme cytochrome c family protein
MKFGFSLVVFGRGNQDDSARASALRAGCARVRGGQRRPRRRMPAFGEQLIDTDIHALIAYIRSVKPETNP